jgi:hypothetical protein
LWGKSLSFDHKKTTNDGRMASKGVEPWLSSLNFCSLSVWREEWSPNPRGLSFVNSTFSLCKNSRSFESQKFHNSSVMPSEGVEPTFSSCKSFLTNDVMKGGGSTRVSLLAFYLHLG